MDWHQPRDRLAMRAYIRGQLRSRGLLEFADDDTEALHHAEEVYRNCGTKWLDNALKMTPLAMDAIQATTTDVLQQSIENTVWDDGEFWSSTGSGNSAAGECLLYRLRTHLGRVTYVGLSVYRAHYQHGEPMYPPRKVSFLTGPTPNQLYPASPIYPVRLTDGQQVFALTPTAVVSEYLMVRMHGRMQRQWEDLQYYIAIRHVQAYGSMRHPTSYIQVARMVPARGLCWPCTRGLAAPPQRPSAPGTAIPLGSLGMMERAGDVVYGTAPVGPEQDSGGGEGSSHAASGTVRCLPLPDVYELTAESSISGAGGAAGPSWWRSLWTGGRPASSRVTPSTAAASEGQLDAGQGDPRSRPTISVSAWAYLRRHATSQTKRSANAGGGAGSGASSTQRTSPCVAAVAHWVIAQSFPGLPVQLRAVPTGPTDTDLQVFLRQDDIARALKLLVNQAWPEMFLIKTAAQAPKQFLPSSMFWGGRQPALARQRQLWDQARGRGQGRSGTVFGKARDVLSDKTAGSDTRQGQAQPQNQSASSVWSHKQVAQRMGEETEDAWRPTTANAAEVGAEDRRRGGPGFKDLRHYIRWFAGLAANGPTGHGRRVVRRVEEPAAAGTSSSSHSGAGLGVPPAPAAAPPPPLQARKHREGTSSDAGPSSHGDGGGGSDGAFQARALRRYYQDGWRRRCHHVARLAMRPAVYRPGGQLFVAMDGWGGGAGLVTQAAVDGEESCGKTGTASAGSWLISHYDNEHL